MFTSVRVGVRLSRPQQLPPSLPPPILPKLSPTQHCCGRDGRTPVAVCRCATSVHLHWSNCYWCLSFWVSWRLLYCLDSLIVPSRLRLPQLKPKSRLLRPRSTPSRWITAITP